MVCSRLKHGAHWHLEPPVTVGLVCSFYLAVRKEANSHLVDGTGHRPHYSLRTLCRALKYVAANPCNGVQRSLYEVRSQVFAELPFLTDRSLKCEGWQCQVESFDLLLKITCSRSILSGQSPIFAGFLPELPDSAGQKFPPCGPEAGVSAHPDGEQQVS